MNTITIPPFSTTGIGSLPHKDPAQAAELSLRSFEIPFWPQLPAISFREHMIPQYAEGMPSLRTDAERGSVWIERNDEEIARFYETCGEGARIAISRDHAQGLYAFLGLIKNKRFNILKGHITGPLTFTLGLTDRDGRAIYFDEELREIGMMLLIAKARWQIEVLGKHAQKVIVFIDEPILSALGGTAYMGVSDEESVRLLKTVGDAIRAAGGIPAIHCCGRADWAMLLKAGIDILNFDAYGYGDTLAIYPEQITRFLQDGGYLAWGIVPTTEAIDAEDPDSIRRIFLERMEILARHVPESLLKSRILLTPSCGTGSLSVPQALKVFQILMRLRESVA